MDFHYPENMTRSEALIRRADKFIEWLHREEYSTYKDEDSIPTLIRVINLMIYAFEESMPAEDWLPSLNKLRDARQQIQDLFETEEARRFNYAEVVTTLLDILDEYKSKIK